MQLVSGKQTTQMVRAEVSEHIEQLPAGYRHPLAYGQNEAHQSFQCLVSEDVLRVLLMNLMKLSWGLQETWMLKAYQMAYAQ